MRVFGLGASSLTLILVRVCTPSRRIVLPGKDNPFPYAYHRAAMQRCRTTLHLLSVPLLPVLHHGCNFHRYVQLGR